MCAFARVSVPDVPCVSQTSKSAQILAVYASCTPKCATDSDSYHSNTRMCVVRNTVARCVAVLALRAVLCVAMSSVARCVVLLALRVAWQTIQDQGIVLAKHCSQRRTHVFQRHVGVWRVMLWPGALFCLRCVQRRLRFEQL